jgi:4-amino-4-deoxy-L-arabinose transferase-like glycosyltransferase
MSSERAEAVPAADRSWNSRDAAFVAGLFAVSLALRIAVVFAFSAQPTWDGAFYHRGALSIAEGNGYSEAATIAGHPGRLPWSHYPVGYSALLGAAYKLFGSGLHVAPLVNALVGAATAVLVYLFGLELLGRRRARVAGALLAFHPGLVLYCTLVMTEPLAGFLVLLTGHLASKLGRHRWGAALCGVVVALSAFVRPQSLLLAPLLLVLFRGTWRQRFTQTALAGAVCVCLLAPWTVRNCLTLDGCALISTNGGWNLAISALSETGRFRPLTPADGCAGVDGPVAQDRCWADVGVAAIERDPWTWLSRIPSKLSHTYNHESFAVAYLAEAQPGAWERDHEWRVMNLMTAFHHLLMFMAALGAVSRFSWRSWREQWPQAAVVAGLVLYDLYALSLPERPLYWVGVLIPVLGFLRLPGSPASSAGFRYLFGLLALTSLTHMVFFGDDRYHLAVSPVFCLLAAAAFRAPARSSQASQAKQRPLPSPSAS